MDQKARRVRYDSFWNRNRQLAANVRRWQVEVAELERRLQLFFEVPTERYPYSYLRTRDVDLLHAEERLRYWTREQNSIIQELNRLRVQISVEDERIRRKIIKPKPPPPVLPQPLIAVLDSMTGYLITYLAEPVLDEQVWLVDEEKQRYVEVVKQVQVEYTFSVETEGHEDVAAEVTAWTIIQGKDLNHGGAIKDITEQLIRRAEDWFYKLFAPPDLGGTAQFGGPIPISSFYADFTIQEREKDARFQGEIHEWQRTLKGVEKLPKVIKRGIGYYITKEDKLWPRVLGFAEWGHDEESVGTHRIPRGAWSDVP